MKKLHQSEGIRSTDNYDRLFRTAVPGGWLYQSTYSNELNDVCATSMCFVADPHAPHVLEAEAKRQAACDEEWAQAKKAELEQESTSQGDKDGE